MFKKYINFTSLGMLAGLIAGSGLGMVLYTHLDGVIYLSLVGVGAAAGMLLGNDFDQRVNAR